MIIDRPSPADYPALKALWKEAFSDTDPFIALFWESGFSPQRCRCILDGGAVVSALYWFDAEKDGEKVAYLYAVATKESRRKEGLCRRLLADTHTHLASLGYTTAVLVPGAAALFDYYEALGYRRFGGVGRASVCAGEASIPLQEISAQTYLALTKKLHPPGSVLLQLPALQFFAKWGSFYRGESCLLAAAKDENTLYVQAFWGDLQAAPAALKTLGCAQGHFLFLGGTEPYGMYYPLVPEDTPPAAFIMDLA